MKKLFIIVQMLGIMFLSGCAQLNDNPPEYVKDVVAYKEGSEGLMIYFILADASGAMTTSDGKVTLTIYETDIEWSFWRSEFIETEVKLYSASFNVKKQDFRKTKVGIGAFEHEVILCPVGRIEYSSFTKRPSKMTGKVKLEFQRPDGRVLKGEGTIIF